LKARKVRPGQPGHKVQQAPKVPRDRWVGSVRRGLRDCRAGKVRPARKDQTANPVLPVLRARKDPVAKLVPPAVLACKVSEAKRAPQVLPVLPGRKGTAANLDPPE
jgi:hypothetical protein